MSAPLNCCTFVETKKNTKPNHLVADDKLFYRTKQLWILKLAGWNVQRRTYVYIYVYCARLGHSPLTSAIYLLRTVGTVVRTMTSRVPLREIPFRILSHVTVVLDVLQFLYSSAFSLTHQLWAGSEINGRDPSMYSRMHTSYHTHIWHCSLNTISYVSYINHLPKWLCSYTCVNLQCTVTLAAKLQITS